MKKYILFCSFILLVSCGEFYSTPDNLDGKEWGLRSIEKKIPINYEEDVQKVEFIFSPVRNSKSYEFRIFFPELINNVNWDLTKSRQDELLKLLDGIELIVSELEGKSPLIHKKLDLDKKPIKSFSFNQSPGKPLSFWLESKIALKKNKEYKVILMLPEARTKSKDFPSSVFVVGIGKSSILVF